MKKIKIGLLGISFDSSNYGCSALGYGFVKLLDEVVENMKCQAELTVFEELAIDRFYELQKPKNIIVNFVKLSGNRRHTDRQNQIEQFKQYDLVFDFTGGDSFSDIYGMKRFISGSLVKINVIRSGTMFVMGNQTYGPFKNPFATLIASYIVKNSSYAFSRDFMSEEYVKKMFKVKLISSIDVAFALPYIISKQKRDFTNIKIGVNPSGLLWSGGYTKGNQFNLNCDYREYCCRVIDSLLKTKKYEIILIPHVVSNNYNYPDNDLVACKELMEKYKGSIQLAVPKSPIEAKSLIASLDIFVGARMHATIAAFSSGVACIPFSYSRKFQGVFSSFNYNYVLDGCKFSTTESIRYTLDAIENYHELKQSVLISQNLIYTRLNNYKKTLQEILSNIKGIS